MKPAPTKEPSARSPFAGCAILIIALAVMMFLVVFSVFALFRQFDEISKFTSEKPAPLEISAIAGQEQAVKDLQGKLDGFHKQLQAGQPASLELTADEINLAIATFEPLKDLRGTFRIQEIGEETLRIAISFKLNGKPRLGREGESSFTSDPRYLNGLMIARPGLSNREVILQVDSIEVPGRPVPKEFVEHMSPYRITERYLTDKILGPAMAKLTRVQVSGNKLVLALIPGEVAKDVISNAQVDSARNRLFTILGIAACLFLLAVGVIVIIGLRAKAAKS